MPSEVASQLIYEGSSKNIHSVVPESLGLIEFEFTDHFSVFDWGRMPDELPYKGKALASIGAFFFEKLADEKQWQEVIKSEGHRLIPLAKGPMGKTVAEVAERLAREGLRTHFVQRSKQDRIRVKQVLVKKPVLQSFGDMKMYHYTNRMFESGAAVKMQAASLIPLEVVFRFGAPKGSSFFTRATDDYLKSHGLTQTPKEGELFSHPIVEFFTKLEPTDRHLSWEQALNYSCLQWEMFAELIASTAWVGAFISHFFAKKELRIWDGKLEWAVIDGKLTLVDSIGPDELRISDIESGVEISKEFLRQFYKTTDWYAAVESAKGALKANPEADWKWMVLQGYPSPPQLPKRDFELAKMIYPTITHVLTGENIGGQAANIRETQ